MKKKICKNCRNYSPEEPYGYAQCAWNEIDNIKVHDNYSCENFNKCLVPIKRRKDERSEI